MGLSQRGYAAHRGVTEGAVRKAIKSGRITPEPDGSIDPDKADRQWRTNTDASKHQLRRDIEPNGGANAIQEGPTAGRAGPLGRHGFRDDLSSQRESQPDLGGVGDVPLPLRSSATLLQARTANEVLRAQTHKLRLSQMKGKLIDRDLATAHVFQLARAERDAWMTWPARVAPLAAAKLNVDPHTMVCVLEELVRDHLLELADFKVQMPG